MKYLRRILVTATAVLTLASGALALDVQRLNDPKPPPKETKEVPKQEKPPPPRENKPDRGGNDKRGGKP